MYESKWIHDTEHFLIGKMELLLILVVIIAIYNPADACRFGSGCAFACNCYNGGTCDPDTGSCPSGCKSGQPPGLGYDWTGPGCQIGNVAYNKDTNQTGAWDRLYSLYAVDGNVGSPSTADRYCAHPDNIYPQPAEWTVDLGDTYTVYNVTIYNKHGSGGSFRLTDFDLWVEETSVIRELCAYYDGPAPAASASLTIQCGGGSGYRGRYVHLRRRDGAVQADLITLCEVIVWGHKYIDCYDCPSGTSCSNIKGCDQCPAGKQLPDCKQDCQAGYHGVNCAETCGRCKEGAVCVPTDGHCQNGCQLWWAGDTCKVEIVLPGCCQGDEGLDPIEDSAITSSSVTISWTQETSVPQGYDNYYGYIVEYRIDGQLKQNFTSISHDSSQTKLTTTVTGLEENTLYFFKIMPYRRSGGQEQTGWAYPEKRATTKCSVPAKPVISDITKQDQGNPSFTVLYQLPEYKDNGCYEVVLQYKLLSGSLWENKTISRTPATGSVTVNNLQEDGYYVRIRVYNKDAETYSDQQNVVFKGTPPPTTTPPTTTPTPTTTPPPTTTKKTKEPGGQKGMDKTTVTVIIAVVVTLAVIIILIIIVIVVLKRRGVIGKRKPTREQRKSTIRVMDDGHSLGIINQAMSDSPDVRPKPPKPPKPQNDAQSIDGEEEEEGEFHTYGNTLDLGPISLDKLEDYVARKKANIKLLTEEYKQLPQEDHSKCKVAEMDANKLKNRFLNIHAYDHSRVVLDPEEDDPSSDYINANYIDGYKTKNTYIATQGPRPHTITDFWRLNWQVNTNRIVMVTNLVENSKRKCDQYWPPSLGGVATHGDFNITLESEDILADYTIRIFSVVKGEESRTVRQFHFTSWEDKKRPLYGAAPILAFKRKVRSFDRLSTGPLVIHCSAGVGRTGTLIAIDILLQQAEEEKQVDFFAWVKKLRQNRMNMVQTKDQYVFLHEAIVDALTVGETFYPCNNFQDKLEELCAPDPKLDDKSELERQLEVLKKIQNQTTTKSKDGWKDANKEKNRDADIVPGDLDRPYLTATRYNKGNNYINAVFVDSFKAHDAYIATQMPLPNTIVDFWRMIHEHNIHAIVMLNELDKTDESCVPYWPDEDEPKQKYGPIEVELLLVNADTPSPNIVIRDFRVSLISEKKKEGDYAQVDTKTVRQIQLLGWSRDEEFPPKCGDLIEVIESLNYWNQQQKTSTNMKTVVHCMNGASRCGLFCGVSFTLDKMKVDQEVDAFLAARYISNRRPQLIESLEQLKFLYEMCIEYTTRHNAYANVQ